MSETGRGIEVKRTTPVEFDQLYDEQFDRIFQYVLLRVANVAEAQDLTSQTFYKALRRLWRFRWSGGSLTAWLYRIATNEVNSHFRRQRVVRSFTETHRNETSPADPSNELEVAEEALARNRIYLELNRALRQLNPDEQALIVLRYFQERPFAEIAEVLRKRQGTLTMRTHRALRKLKTEMERRGVDHERVRESLARSAEAGCTG